MKKAIGLIMTLPSKQDVMVNFRGMMEEGRVELPFDPELFNELNVSGTN